MEIFRYDTSPVRTITIDGEPWFIAADVAAVLGYRDAHNAARMLDDDERGTHLVSTPGGHQRVTVISESGLYTLTLRSDMPDAKRFRKWVTAEVLPSIRRTGGYESGRLPAQMPTHPQALRGWAEAIERAELAETKVAELEPSAQAWDTLASAHGDYSVRESAFILNRDPAINTGQTRLFQLLRDWRLIDRNDRPYADHASHVTLRARSYEHPVTGEQKTTTQVRITAQGLRYIHRRLGGTQQISA